MAESSFFEHLEALRRVLLKSLAALALAFIPGYWAARFFIPSISAYCLPGNGVSLHYFTPMEAFVTELKMGAATGFVISFPYIAYQVWGFVSPALYRREKRLIKRLSLFSTLLFLAGAAFAFFLIVPLLMRFALSFSGPKLQPVFGLASFLGLTAGLTLAGGLLFQLPIILIALVRCGAVKAATISRCRPYAIVALLVIAGLATPPDVVSQILFFIPSYVLFELGLFLARR